MAVDGAGNVYVADTWNNTIRKIAPGGVVTTVAGLAGSGWGSADGPGSAARFYYPDGVAVDGAGHIHVADTGNQRICKTVPTCPDEPTTDLAIGPVGVQRQLDTVPQTATQWLWRLIRQHSSSTAALSSSTIRNPTFTPDVADLFVFELRATNALGAICIRTLELTAVVQTTTPPVLSVAGAGSKIGLSWIGADGFTLESTEKLGLGAVWSPVPGVVTNTVTVNATGGSQFYRLRKP